jgi:hypothetical protein
MYNWLPQKMRTKGTNLIGTTCVVDRGGPPSFGSGLWWPSTQAGRKGLQESDGGAHLQRWRQRSTHEGKWRTKKVEALERSTGAGSGKIEREASRRDARKSHVQRGTRPTCRRQLFPPRSDGSWGAQERDPMATAKRVTWTPNVNRTKLKLRETLVDS